MGRPKRDRREQYRAYHAKNRDRVNAERNAARKDPVLGARLREMERARYWADPKKQRERIREWQKAQERNPQTPRQIELQQQEELKRELRRDKLAHLRSPEHKEEMRQKKLGRERIAKRAKREVNILKQREWRRLHPDKVRERNAKRYAANPERARQARRNWFRKMMQTDPEAIRARLRVYTQRRRARKNTAGGSFTVAELRDLFKRQGGKCACCKTKITWESGPLHFHIDHVMPLARKGSTNNIENIQLLCKTCNSRKKAKHPDDWAKENGLLFC